MELIAMILFQVAGAYFGGRKLLFWVWLAEAVGLVIYLVVREPVGSESEVALVDGVILFTVVLLTLSAVAIAGIHFWVVKYRTRVQNGV